MDRIKDNGINTTDTQFYKVICINIYFITTIIATTNKWTVDMYLIRV